MQGYQVLLASDGKEALEVFENEHVDLIISDIAMPEMDGFGLLEEIRSRENGKAIPFLFFNKTRKMYWTAYGAVLLLTLIAFPFLPQMLHYAVVPLILSGILRAFVNAKIER